MLFLGISFLMLWSITACSKKQEEGVVKKSTENQGTEVTTEIANSNLDTTQEDIQYYYKELEDGTLAIYDYDAEKIPETLEIPSEINGKIVTKLDGIFSQEDKIKKVVIPESVNEIGNNTFVLSTSIEEVEIRGVIEKIGETTFYCCDKLNSLYFKEGLIKIDVDSISECPLLKEIHMPNTVDEIVGWGTFYGCSPELTVYAPAGSYVEEYVKTVEVAFQAE